MKISARRSSMADARGSVRDCSDMTAPIETMNQTDPSRRSFLRAACAFAAVADARNALAQSTVPFSRGTEAPRLKAPPLACDSHLHIMDTRFPASPHWKGQPVEDATVDAYRQLQKRIGTAPAVLGNPSTSRLHNPR